VLCSRPTYEDTEVLRYTIYLFIEAHCIPKDMPVNTRFYAIHIPYINLKFYIVYHVLCVSFYLSL
jgi:hypothetical protein